VPSPCHWVLQNLKRVRLETEYSLLGALLAEEPYHYCTLVQGMEDLRDLRALAQRHSRHGYRPGTEKAGGLHLTTHSGHPRLVLHSPDQARDRSYSNDIDRTSSFGSRAEQILFPRMRSSFSFTCLVSKIKMVSDHWMIFSACDY